jgi:DNA-binding beta-propeller fold protein YncE
MSHRLPLLLLTLSLLFAFSPPAQAADSATLASAISATPAASSGPLAVLKTIPLGGDGGWDYLTVDSSNHRLFIARATRVMVVDLLTDKLLAEIPDTPGCHGIALVPDRNEGFITSAGKKGDPAGNVVVFDTKSLKVLRTIPAGNRPDAILYDPASKKVFAFNHGDGTVTVIDPAAPADSKPATIEVGGTLEFGATDGKGRVYVNVEDKSEVVAIDSKELKVLAHWSISPAKEPTGLDIDVASNRLFSATSGKMVVLETNSGKVVDTEPTGNGVDGCAYDPKPSLLLSANGKDGTVTVMAEIRGDSLIALPTGKCIVVQTLPTAKGARTIAVDPPTHRFYLPCNITDQDGKPTFGLVVVGPKEK